MHNILSAFFCIALLGGCATAPDVQRAAAGIASEAPERASRFTEKSGWIAKNFMVVAANPLASDAGYRVLKEGGSAVDAAIAVQMVLTLVEPQSSGIGGGAFLLHFDGKSITAFDGRETAPSAATDRLFQTGDGTPMRFAEAVVGGRSVGAPGVLRMLELAHAQHGKLPWATLFAQAIRLAEEGFAISPRLAALLKADPHLKKDPTAAAYFYDADGEPRPVGHVLKNPELASVLREIAAGGADRFYTGPIAQDIENKVKSHGPNPGLLTRNDIAAYRAKIREPICSDYKSWTVCGMPPPSSGGIAIAQLLGILETKNIALHAPEGGAPSAEAVHLFSEAGRLVYADRARYIADTDFVPLPGNDPAPLLDKAYLASRAATIGPESMMRAAPGVPPEWKTAWGMDQSPEHSSTSHVSIVDAEGNAVAMTTTIESAFGARQMVRGFLLNNQLTDFSFNAYDAAGPIANRVQPGKRPRSSMAPTLVFEKGTKNLVLTIGSPGGPAIINYVGKTLVGMMDWGLDVQQAINLPNFGSRNGPTELEQGRVTDELIEKLKQKDHAIRVTDQTSGLHGIMRLTVHGETMWFGGADPRREGVARGD
jgi:gamma-glutamyltranspeptidase/glutathione hydrolase